MTITTDQAIALAQEVGATVACQFGEHYEFDISSEELTALCNKVREQTLLEAADAMADEFGVTGDAVADELRRMAGGGVTLISYEH